MDRQIRYGRIPSGRRTDPGQRGPQRTTEVLRQIRRNLRIRPRTNQTTTPRRIRKISARGTELTIAGDESGRTIRPQTEVSMKCQACQTPVPDEYLEIDTVRYCYTCGNALLRLHNIKNVQKKLRQMDLFRNAEAAGQPSTSEKCPRTTGAKHAGTNT